ncbi:hypothetical protein [Variovorax gossypii]
MAKDENVTDAGSGSARAASEDLAWKRFVLVDGGGARNTELAHILHRTVAEIEVVKRSHSGGKRGWRGRDFDALFEKWNGRPPRDEEWPIPFFYEKRGSYEWQAPEVAVLATLVGQLSVTDIAEALTVRLQTITGDARAKRGRMAVQNQIARMGLMSSDLLGGIAVPDAAREVGSYQLVHQAIRNRELEARKIGARLMIGHKAWAAWKAKIQAPPEDFVQLSTLKGPLGISSDKLPEFARMGYVPNAIQCKPFGTKGMNTTQFGSWYVPKAVADQLLADRREGRPMPWHGKPLLDNLKVTFRLWQEREHPKDCATCAQIWGKAGAPADFDEYIQRYPALAHGAKRHLTMVWHPGVTVGELVQRSLRSEYHVRRSIDNGVLAAQLVDGVLRITRTDAARWIARRCPTGDAEKSWLSFESAEKQYLLSEADLVDLCDRGVFKLKIGTKGRYVLRQQCAQYRERVGFSEEEAAMRAKVSVPQMRELLQGVDWRGAKGIPLVTVQAVIKRLQSQAGKTFEQASEELGATVQWIEERVADGTVTVKRNKWDDRLYLTNPMVARLREAFGKPVPRGRLDANWIRLADAGHMAGVSTTTLARWGEAGEIRRSQELNGMHYHQDDVRARARLYWKTSRYRRAKLPAWLVAELQGAPVASAPQSATQTRQRAAAEARSSDAAPIVEDDVTPLVDLLIGWLATPKFYLNTLRALRARFRRGQGEPSESEARVRKLLAERFVRMSDYDLVAFDDIDAATRGELVKQALAFVGASRDSLGAEHWSRIQVAIARRLAGGDS